MRHTTWGLGLVVSFAMAMAPSMAAPADESAGERAPDLEVLRRWQFDRSSGLDGWTAAHGVADLRVEGGRLTGRLSEDDAYILAPPVEAPLDGLVVRVVWSSPRGGSVQCYYATATQPHMAESRVISREVLGGREVETEFDVGMHAGGTGTLTGFRLDPFNGRRGETFTIDEVVIGQIPPRLEAIFAPAAVASPRGDDVPFRLRWRRLGGRVPSASYSAAVLAASGAVAPGGPASVALDARSVTNAWEWSLRFTKSGVHTVRLVLNGDGGRVAYDLEACVAVGLEPKPTRLELEGEHAAIELLSAQERRTAAARLWLRSGDGWRDAGLLFPLVEIVTTAETGGIRRRLPALDAVERGAGALRLAGEADGGRVTVSLSLARAVGQGQAVAVEAEIAPRAGTRILRFGGPAVRRTSRPERSLERHALFGGLEMLEPGWSSSSARAVGPQFAARWCPHPFKVSLPAMAIEADGVTTALLWHPLAPWSEGRVLPAATFASPNFIEAEPGHFLQLSVPSVPEEVDESSAWARRPLVSRGEPLRIAFLVRAARDEPVVLAARRWYEHFGTPAPPPARRGSREVHDLVARAYGETLFWPDEKGWRGHWFIEHTSHFRPEFAAELRLHALVTGDKRWIEATGLDPKTPLVDVAGTLWSRALGGEPAAAASLQALREDGTYGYHDSPAAKEATRRHTGGRFDTLGEDGSTSLGTCVQAALPLLRQAVVSSDERLLAGAVRALGGLRRFRIPRGAQVWEVHQEIPDIRAAALAVEAFRLGYLATGDAAHLDAAAYWADAGLPFLFSWRVPERAPAVVKTSRSREGGAAHESLPAAELFAEPERQVTPYGTIPVFGTTYYVASWFGVLVQWCGLEWAWKVLELCDLRQDPILRAAALGVVRSGLEQTFDRPPWAGIYPDVWNLEGNWAGGALISPHLLVQALRAGGELPPALRTWTRRTGDGPSALLVHGWGECAHAAIAPDGRLEVRVRFLAAEEGELLIARAPRPAAVRVDGREIPEAASGWRADSERRLVGVRYAAAESEARIEVLWKPAH